VRARHQLVHNLTMSTAASRSPLGENATVLTDSFGLVIPNGTPIRAPVHAKTNGDMPAIRHASPECVVSPDDVRVPDRPRAGSSVERPAPGQPGCFLPQPRRGRACEA